MSRMCLHHATTVAREPSAPGPIRSAAGKPSPAVRLTWSLLATRPPPTPVRSAPTFVLQTALLHVHRQGPRLLAVAPPGLPSSVQVSRQSQQPMARHFDHRSASGCVVATMPTVSAVVLRSCLDVCLGLKDVEALVTRQQPQDTKCT
jgi:hypothetical protein